MKIPPKPVKPKKHRQPPGMLRVIVRRVWFDQIVTGRKTIEYRRHAGIFNARNFYPGREFWLDWRHSHATGGIHGFIAVCTDFAVTPLGELDDANAVFALKELYPDMDEASEVAMIHVTRKVG